MKIHVETLHESLNPYKFNIHLELKCESCKKSFGQKRYLDLHVSIVHENIKNHKCDYCDASFGFKSQLNTHVKTVHEKNIRD